MIVMMPNLEYIMYTVYNTGFKFLLCNVYLRFMVEDLLVSEQSYFESVQ